MSTKEKLIDAAIETVRERGYAGTTSRAIATRAGLNQALVYYHYGSVDGLLLAALDELGARRLQRYRRLVDEAETLDELIGAAARMYQSDRRSGHVSFVSQLVAASVADPELAREVLARMEPWIDFTRGALRKALAQTPFGDLLPADELAYAIVTYYLGLNLLTQLDPRRARAQALFESLRGLSGLLGQKPATLPGH
jgi:AcrR family transcriptional regulator